MDEYVYELVEWIGDEDMVIGLYRSFEGAKKALIEKIMEEMTIADECWSTRCNEHTIRKVRVLD